MDASGSASPLLTPGADDSSANGYTLAVIGCGTMGVAIMSGVLDSKAQVDARKNAMAAAAASQQQQSNGVGDRGASNGASLSDSIASLLDVDNESADHSTSYLPSRFIACVSRTESARRLKKTFAAHAEIVEVVASSNVKAAQEADVVLLACKPQMVSEILKEKGMREALHGKLVCSICAGLRIEQIIDMVDHSTSVVRAMPNTPSKVRSIVFSRLFISSPELTRSFLLCPDSPRNDHPYSLAFFRSSCVAVAQNTRFHLPGRRTVSFPR